MQPALAVEQTGAEAPSALCPLPPRALEPARCEHCALPIPKTRGGSRFCCAGCQAVYALLQHADLASYYRLRERTPDEPVPAQGDDYACFDDAAFIAEHTRRVGEAQQVQFYLQGVHCHACVWLVEKLGRVVPGVQHSELSFGERSVRVLYDPARTSPGRIAAGLHGLGYVPHPRVRSEQGQVAAREDRDLLLRLGVAGAAAGNVMLLAIALYSGAARDATSSVGALMRAYSAAIAIPATLYSAQPFFRGAWAAVRTRSAHMDLPISIGIVAGLGWGAVGALGGSGEIYLDSVCMLVFLLLAGRFVQLRQMRKAQGQSELLLALAPTHAERVGERGLERVRAEQLLPGDVVRVRVGQAIPVDGVVCAGQSRLDTALLTGESRPRAVAVGSEVQAGALNVQAPLEVRATVSGTNTRIAGLLHSFSSIRAERSRIRVLADRLSGLFVLAALALALLALWVGAQQGLKTGIERAVALLVVTCPCALGLATSLGSTLAMGRAARCGLLIKGGAFIEAVARPGLFVFDKTGTLSRGELTLGERRGVDAQRLAQLGCSLDALLCALERDSTHPIARAIEAQCGAAPGPMLQLEHWREEVGRGVRAVYQGHQLCLGSPQFSAPEPDAATASAIAAVRAAGQSPVLLGVDGAVACVLGFSDPLRDDTTETLHALSAQGYQLAIASGDDPDIVARVAAATGAHFRFVQGGLSPEQTHELVQQQLQAGPVYMVGDGVNDGAALAGATVGIAVHGGAEASLAVADVFATRPGLGTVALLVRGSRRTLAVIRRNFAFSLAYNLITALLAIAGYITPLLAAVLMPLSSFLIATSSFASTTFEESA